MFRKYFCNKYLAYIIFADFHQRFYGGLYNNFYDALRK
jgi:hypothetical protein